MKETMRADLQARISASGIPYKVYTDSIDNNTAEQFANCLEAKGVAK